MVGPLGPGLDEATFELFEPTAPSSALSPPKSRSASASTANVVSSRFAVDICLVSNLPRRRRCRAVLTLSWSSIQVSSARGAVGKLGEELEAIPVPDVGGALRDDADTVDVVDSCPLRQQPLGEPPVEARALHPLQREGDDR